MHEEVEQPIEQPNCRWCRHSQIRHGALHCGVDEINLETSASALGDVAQNCKHYEFDAVKHSLRRFHERIKIMVKSQGKWGL